MSFYSDETYIQSLARGLAVFRSFQPGRERLTMAEVAHACDVTRAGARRVLLTLQDLGYVAQEGREYFLTSRVLELSDCFLKQSIWQTAKPVLQGVVDTLNETASIGVLEQFEVIYVLRIRSSRLLHLDHLSAGPPHTHTSSIGRVLLAGLRPSQLRRYLQQAEFERYTPHTVCDRDRYVELIDEVRERGWCQSRGEVDEAVAGVAVPIKNSEGETVAAISIGSTNERASPEYVRETIVPVLQAAAETISKSL